MTERTQVLRCHHSHHWYLRSKMRLTNPFESTFLRSILFCYDFSTILTFRHLARISYLIETTCAARQPAGPPPVWNLQRLCGLPTAAPTIVLSFEHFAHFAWTIAQFAQFAKTMRFANSSSRSYNNSHGCTILFPLCLLFATNSPLLKLLQAIMCH